MPSPTARMKQRAGTAVALTVAVLVASACRGVADAPSAAESGIEPTASPPSTTPVAATATPVGGQSASPSAPEPETTVPPAKPAEGTPATGAVPTTSPHAGAPLARFSDGRFAGSGDCAVCHSLLTDSEGQDVSIDAHWRSTMMANAAKDPLWQAKVSSEVARNPGLSEAIEDKCATCHMPMARTQAVAEGEPVGVFPPGFLDPDHPSSAAALDGVSCTLCHQIQARDLGQESSFSGQYTIDRDTKLPDRLAFGPFELPFQNPMRMMVGFIPVEGAQTREAELCATCHTLFTPYVDATGTVLGTFPEQMPYLEWRESAYSEGRGISCQNCHMPPASGQVVISNHPPGPMLKARSAFAQHHFVGGNAFMLGVYKAYGPELGLTAGTTELDKTLARTKSQLAGAATLSFAELQVADGVLTTVLEVASSAGHKFPTGFPSRRAWIHFTVVDEAGIVVFESGQPLPGGAIDGNDADFDGAYHEPHHDLISTDDQVQIYEAIMQDSEGEVTYTLLRAASYVKDNRLLPRGFDKKAAGQDIAVHGAAANDQTFVGGSDRITYRIDLRPHSGALTVTAALLYQTVSYRFVQDLSGDRTTEVDRFAGFYDGLAAQPEVVATATRTTR